MAEDVSVEQCDREAAAGLFVDMGEPISAANSRLGRMDDCPTVLAFARHRTLSPPAGSVDAVAGERWQPIETAPKDGTRILLWTSTRITESDIRYVEVVCGGEHLDCAQIGGVGLAIECSDAPA